MAEGGSAEDRRPENSLREEMSGTADPATYFHNGSLRFAVSFLKPSLALLKFTPSHACAILTRTDSLVVDRNKMLSVIKHERQKEVMNAVTVLVDWLLELEGDNPNVLPAFLDALRSDTAEHLHVHDVVCVSSVYLPVHQDLVRVLAERLQGGALSVNHLLHFLQQFRLLEPQRAPQILEMAQGSEENPHEEDRHVRVATCLLACVYSNIAKVLMEMHGSPEDTTEAFGSTVSENTLRPNISAGPQNRSTSSPRSLEATEEATDSPGIQGSRDDVDPGVDLADHREANAVWIDRLTNFIADSLYDDRVATDPAEDGGTEREREERLEEAMAAWSRQRGELWPVVLQRVLEGASGQTGLWGHAEHDPAHLKTLWDKASELVRSRIGDGSVNPLEQAIENGEAEAMTAAGNEGSEADSHNRRAETAREVDAGLANLAPLEQERVKKYLHSSKLHDFNVVRDPSVSQDDLRSIVSEENNARQQQRGLGPNAGVLREEEARVLKEGPIQLRPYQDELLTAAREGKNVLIMLPTGTGKTYIVLKYAEEHLKSGDNTRVGFVVPKVRLARQQFERFQAYLPAFKPYLKCGETSGTAGSRQPLSDVLQSSRVVVMTGQCLVEAVENKKVSLNQFSMLVLDECHHTRGGHPLRSLMNQYMELKFGEGSTTHVKLPQIIGLTASPGVGKARGKDLNEAEKYLNQLCARLDVTHICSVRKNLEDLKKYVNEPQHDIRECAKRKVDKLKEVIETLMQVLEQNMVTDPNVERYWRQMEQPQSSTNSPAPLRRQLEAPTTQRGEDQYTQWLSNADKAIKDVDNPNALYALTAHINMLQHCQRCLILNEDCDSLGALELLEEEVERMRQEKPNKEQVDHDLFEIFERYTQYESNDNDVFPTTLRALCQLPECQNPKLKHLEELLLNATLGDQTDKDQQLENAPQRARSEAPRETDSAAVERKEAFRNEAIPFDAKAETEQTHCKQLLDVFPDGSEALVESDSNAAERRGDPGTEADLIPVAGREEGPGAAGNDNNGGDVVSEVASMADTVDTTDCASVIGSEMDHLDNNVRGMIFVRTLDLSKALLKWMERHPKLWALKPGRITGVNASVKNGGMTKSEVTEVMAKFNAGIHKVVICTSAAEEGLDFKACNLVIRYLYEASMVSMIQTRGRAREQDSRYCVMGRQSSDSTAKERDNLQSELTMREAVKRIQEAVDRDPEQHIQMIQALQRDNWTHRWRKDVQDAKRLRQQLPEGLYRLICGGCGTAACTSENIRLLRRTNRVVLGAEFSNKYERRDDDSSTYYDSKIPRTGKLHCRNCGHYWGIMVRSIDDGVEFPVIPIKSFIIEDHSGGRKLVDKWGQAFSVPEITEEDRQRHCEPLLSGENDRLEGDFQTHEEEEGEEEAQDNLPSNDLSSQGGLSSGGAGAAARENEEQHGQPSNDPSNLERPSPGRSEAREDEVENEVDNSQPSNDPSNLEAPLPEGAAGRSEEDPDITVQPSP